MDFLLVGLLVIAVLFLWLKWNSKKKKMNLAYNVLLAQFTFYNEDMPTQNLVYEKARSILAERTSKKFADVTFDESPNLLVVFGFYALAMRELGIAPLLPGYDVWFEVNNPFLAESGISRELKLATAEIEKRTNVCYDHWIS